MKTIFLILCLSLILSGCKSETRAFIIRKEYKVICPNIGTFQIYEMSNSLSYYYADKNTMQQISFPDTCVFIKIKG